MISFDSSGAFDGQVVTREWGAATASMSMAQETFRHYGQDESQFRITETDSAGAEQEHFVGEQSGQYLNVATPAAGAAIGMKWLWQQFSKEFEVTSEAVIVHLWSPRGGLLDFRVKGCIEFWGDKLFAWWKQQDKRKRISQFAANANGFDNAKGMEKSHELWLWPQASPAAPAQVAEFGRLIEQPVLAMATPEWNCASGVFGPIAPKDPTIAPAAEDLLERMIARRHEAADRFGDYGWWAFGSNDHAGYTAHSYEDKGDTRLLATPYRFTHATYGHLRSLWALYYRSGDRRILDYLLPRMYHLLDIRVKHLADTNWAKGAWAGYPNMPVPWWSNDTYFSNTIDFGLTEGLWTWYATGDSRWREWAEDWVAYSRDFTSRPGWPDWYLDKSYSGYTASWARGTLFYLNSLTAVYAHSGDPVLLERATALAHRIIAPDQLNGVRRTKDNHLLGEPYYWLHPLMHYAAQSGDANARTACTKLTAFLYYAVAGGATTNPNVSDLAWGYALNDDVKFLSEAMFNLGNILHHRLPQLEAPINTREGARSLTYGSQDKQFWEGLPRLVWGLKKQRATGKAIPPAVALPAVSKTIVLDKIKDRPLTAELKSSIGLETVIDPSGQTGPASWHASIEYEAFWWQKYFVTHVSIPAAAPAGTYLLRADSQITLLSTNAPHYAAWVPAGFPIRAAAMSGPLCLPTQHGRLVLRVRFPDQIVVRNSKGAAIAPTNAEGQQLEFTGLQANEIVLLETAGKNYLELTGAEMARRWVSHGDPARLFIPNVKIPEVSRPVRGHPDALYIKGVDPDRADDRALQLAAGRELVLPTHVTVDGEDVPVFPGAGMEGTVEFWYCPLWDPRWIEKEYFDMYMVEARSFRFSYYGHADGDKVSADAWGPLNRGWMQRNITFEPGRWYHFAISWYPWDKAANKILLLSFVDGVPQGHVRSGNYVADTGGWKPQPGMTLAPELRLGSMGKFSGPALFDEIRVSDIARYKEMKTIADYEFKPLPITPSRKRFAVDEHTLMLLHFDGDTTALSARSPEGVAGAVRDTK